MPQSGNSGSFHSHLQRRREAHPWPIFAVILTLNTYKYLKILSINVSIVHKPRNQIVPTKTTKHESSETRLQPQ